MHGMQPYDQIVNATAIAGSRTMQSEDQEQSLPDLFKKLLETAVLVNVRC